MPDKKRVELMDFITFGEALTKLNISEGELLRAALSQTVKLYYLTERAERLVFELAQLEEAFEGENLWVPICNYNEDARSLKSIIEVDLGEPIELNVSNLRALMVTGECSVYDVLSAQLDADSAIQGIGNSNYSGGLVKWVAQGREEYSLQLGDTYLVASELRGLGQVAAIKSATDV